MREADFTAELQKSLAMIGAWAYKIPDIPLSKIRGMSFNPLRPFDLVVCHKGKFIAIECKQIKQARRFGGKDIRMSQVLNLSGVKSKGGMAFVMLNLRMSSLNRLIIFEWGEWKEKILLGIPHKELLKLPYIQGVGGIFNSESIERAFNDNI